MSNIERDMLIRHDEQLRHYASAMEKLSGAVEGLTTAIAVHNALQRRNSFLLGSAASIVSTIGTWIVLYLAK